MNKILKIILPLFINLSTLILLFLGSNAANGQDINSIIKRFCLKQFKLEMKAKEIIPPPQMAEFSCNCFISEISKGISFDSAELLCKESAYKKFFNNK